MKEAGMTAYLISLALTGLILIVLWEGLSWERACLAEWTDLTWTSRIPEIPMPKAVTEIRSLARSHTRTALNVLVGVMRSNEATPAARVAAANAILDRGWGKAPQAIENGNGAALVHRIERLIVRPENTHGWSLRTTAAAVALQGRLGRTRLWKIVGVG
jgi:hypothetical protein